MQQKIQLSHNVHASRKPQFHRRISARWSLARSVLALCVLTVSSEGFCQLTNATTKLGTLQTWLAGLALTIFTIVFMYIGYALAFGGKSFGELWKILVGGFFVGGAAGLAAFAAG